MKDSLLLNAPQLEKTFYQLFRGYFDLAEKKRRWSLRDDIPWQHVNKHLSPAIADVVESFCAVELYLPDYVANALSAARASRSWSWPLWG
jgi:acyl-[acyl-carrier-protein] desaturase